MITQNQIDSKYILGQLELLTDGKVTYKVSEWAEAKRYIPPELTPLPGFYENANNPAMVEIMDCMSENSPIREVALKKGVQIGWTTAVLENFLGYIIDYMPGPTMFVTGTKDMAEQAVELRIDRMIEGAGLHHKIFAQNKQTVRYNRKTGDTKSKKEFPNGFILPIGANSPKALRMTSVRFLLMDEIDTYPLSAGKEGSPITLAQARTNAFEHQRKILYGSTPLIKHLSQIDKLYEKGDQRKYHVPCKDCGEFQELLFEHIVFEQDEEGHLIVESVAYVCQHCGVLWKNSDKEFFLIRGKWVPTSKSFDITFRSYHLNALYAPVGMFSWEKAVADFLDTKTDMNKFKTFKNNVEGISWEEKGQRVDSQRIIENRIDYDRGTVPPEVILLTAAVDVHDDLFYIEIVGWGRDQVTYSIDWIELEVPNKSFSSEGWDALEEVLSKKYGELSIMMAFVDSGYMTDRVYKFCSRFGSGVYPCKGGSKFTGKNAYKKSEVAGEDNIILYVLAGDFYKDKLYGWLSLEKKSNEKYPWGYCLYPSDYPDEFFKGYENEFKVQKFDKNNEVSHHTWQRRSNSAFNEPWDVRYYAIAAFDALYAQERAILELEDDESFSIEQFFDYIEESNS